MTTIQVVYAGQNIEKIGPIIKTQVAISFNVKPDTEAVIKYATSNLVRVVIVYKNAFDGLSTLRKILPILQEGIVFVTAENKKVMESVLTGKRVLLQAYQQVNYSLIDDALKAPTLPMQIK